MSISMVLDSEEDSEEVDSQQLQLQLTPVVAVSPQQKRVMRRESEVPQQQLSLWKAEGSINIQSNINDNVNDNVNIINSNAESDDITYTDESFIHSTHSSTTVATAAADNDNENDNNNVNDNGTDDDNNNDNNNYDDDNNKTPVQNPSIPSLLLQFTHLPHC